MKILKHTPKLILLVIALAPYLLKAQTRGGVNEFTGALIIQDLSLVSKYGATLASAVASRFPTANLQSAGTTAGSPIFGHDSSGAMSFSVSYQGNSVGMSVTWSYVLGPDGNVWLQYTINGSIFYGGSTTSQVQTGTPSSILNGKATATTAGLKVTGTEPGTYQGNAGTWVTAEIDVTYCYTDQAGVFHCVLEEDTVTFFDHTAPHTPPLPPAQK